MSKEKIIRENVFDEDGNFIGWFDRNKAERFNEATRWDGSNHISIPTGSQWDIRPTYRRRARVLSWSQWDGRPERYRFIDGDEAREWLLLNEEDEAVERLFGEIEDEVGPGRPEIGRPIIAHLPPELTAQLDQMAERIGVPRAEVIRRLLTGALK